MGRNIVTKDLERKVKSGLHDLLKELLQERKEARKNVAELPHGTKKINAFPPRKILK